MWRLPTAGNMQTGALKGELGCHQVKWRTWEKAQMEGELRVQGISERKGERTGRNRGWVSSCKTEEEGYEKELRVCSNSVGSRRVSTTLAARGQSSLPSLTSSRTALPMEVVEAEVRCGGLRSKWKEKTWNHSVDQAFK